MVRLKIKDFFTETSGQRVSLRAPYSAEEEITVVAPVRISGTMMDRKYAYLSVSGIVGEAEIFFGEASLGKILNGERKNYDIKQLLSIGECEIKITLSCGAAIVEPPTLLSFNSAVIDGVHVTERHEGGAVTLDIKLRTLGSSDGVKAIATLVSGAGQIYYGGITRGYGSIKVRDPLYWWPRGLGVQNLYRLTVNLYGESDVEDTEELLVGLRSASVLREGGTRLSFNDLAFVPMGALYTPPIADGIEDRISVELTSLAKGGANAVFLDSSVKYIPSSILELCDREGLVLIRETGELKAEGAELERLSNHPSLAFLIIPEGENQDALYTAARGSAPDVAIILGREFEGAIIETLPSVPEEKTIEAIGDARERNPHSSKMLLLGGDAYRDTLLRVADEYLFPSGPAQLGYLTRLLQAKEAQRKIVEARLSGGEELPFAVYSELCDRVCAPSHSAIDSLGRKKLLYFIASRALSPVCATARRTDSGADITVINQRRREFSGRAYYRVLDSSNNLVYNYAEEITVPPMSFVTLEARLDELIAGREAGCYLEYGLSSYDAQYSDTLLFVKPKDFTFEKPNIKVKVDGAGTDFTVTLSSDKFVAGVEVLFDLAEVELSDSGFDLTSSAPVKLSAKLHTGKLTAEELEKMIRINYLNNIGFEN